MFEEECGQKVVKPAFEIALLESLHHPNAVQITKEEENFLNLHPTLGAVYHMSDGVFFGMQQANTNKISKFTNTCASIECNGSLFPVIF